MLGAALGGPNNYNPSLITQIYGRDGAAVAFPVSYAITGVFRAIPFAIHSLSLALRGDYSISYIAFAVSALISIIMFKVIDFSPKQDPIHSEQVT